MTGEVDGRLSPAGAVADAPAGSGAPADAETPGHAWTPAPGEPAAMPAGPVSVPGEPEPSAPGRRPLGPAGLVVLVIIAALVASAATMGVARITGWGKQTTIIRYEPNNTTIPTNPGDIQGILARVLPGVVSISATTTVRSPFFNGGTASTVVDSGTGMIMNKSGEVVTNDHVVSGATSVTVTLNDSTTPLVATIVGESPAHDLALLQVHGATDLTPVVFGNSDDTLVGDSVVAIGYALGMAGGPTVTSGIISAKGRQVATQTSEGLSVTLTSMLQTDAAISSGNSGGPLVDANAQVIGINTVVATSSGSTTAQNIGFAIPSATVEAVVAQLGRSA